MFDQPLVSIIIVNWNGENLLEECINSVMKSNYSNIEIIVVDNCSTDKSIQVLSHYENIQIHKNPTNSGYTGGNNIGFDLSKGKYLVTLNNDVIVNSGWLDEAINILEKDPTIGMVSCRQMQYNMPHLIDSLFNVAHFDLSFSSFCSDKPYECIDPSYKSVSYVLSANGGSAIIRKSMINQIGNFDEHFFGYYDEIDLCTRALLYGWKCIYVPQSVVFHKGGASFGRNIEKRLLYRERNRIWFLYKNYPLSFILLHIPALLLLELRVARVMIFKYKFLGAYFRARLEAFKGLSFFKETRSRNVKLFKLQKKYYLKLIKKKLIPYNRD